MNLTLHEVYLEHFSTETTQVAFRCVSSGGDTEHKQPLTHTTRCSVAFTTTRYPTTVASTTTTTMAEASAIACQLCGCTLSSPFPTSAERSGAATCATVWPSASQRCTVRKQVQSALKWRACHDARVMALSEAAQMPTEIRQAWVRMGWKTAIVHKLQPPATERGCAILSVSTRSVTDLADTAALSAQAAHLWYDPLEVMQAGAAEIASAWLMTPPVGYGAQPQPPPHLKNVVSAAVSPATPQSQIRTVLLQTLSEDALLAGCQASFAPQPWLRLDDPGFPFHLQGSDGRKHFLVLSKQHVTQHFWIGSGGRRRFIVGMMIGHRLTMLLLHSHPFRLALGLSRASRKPSYVVDIKAAWSRIVRRVHLALCSQAGRASAASTDNGSTGRAARTSSKRARDDTGSECVAAAARKRHRRVVTHTIVVPRPRHPVVVGFKVWGTCHSLNARMI